MWYQHIELEMWKRYTPITKSASTARTYDRLCYNDTILEYQCSYIKNDKFKQFYIKTAHSCVSIKLIDEIDFMKPDSIIPDMLKFANLYFRNDKTLRNTKRNIEQFHFSVSPNYFIYQNIDFKGTLFFPKNSLGLLGIQPGLEKYDVINSTHW